MKCGFCLVLVLAMSCANPPETEAAHSSSFTLADAIRMARPRLGDSIVAHAGVDPDRPGKYWVVSWSGGRLKAVEVDAASGQVVEVFESRGDDSFYPEMADRMPSMKIDVERAIEIALAEVAGGTARDVDVGLRGDGPGTRVKYIISVQDGDETVEKEIDLSNGEVIPTEKDEKFEAAEELDRSPVESGTVTLDFEGETTGSLPEDWYVQATGPQSWLATWEAVADSSVSPPGHLLALTRTNHGSSSTFNLCWTNMQPFRNGTIELSMKPVSGEEDQGGGPIWRVKDKDNYYVCRANPLEGNFRLYVVQNGERKQLADAAAEIEAGQWHAIRVEHGGNRIECWLDGEKLLEAIDDTLPAAGGFGFWTKADAVTSFDDLRVSTTPDPAGSEGR